MTGFPLCSLDWQNRALGIRRIIIIGPQFYVFGTHFPDSGRENLLVSIVKEINILRKRCYYFFNQFLNDEDSLQFQYLSV